MKQMKADDALDACLTDEGEEQAKAASMKREVEEAAKNLQLVVASPLSRAIDTANLVFPPSLCPLSPKRLILEEVREINGLLLNGQRRTKSVIEQLYPSWDCSRLTTEEDESWTEHELEGDDSVRGRGGNRQGAKRWLEQSEQGWRKRSDSKSIIQPSYITNNPSTRRYAPRVSQA